MDCSFPFSFGKKGVKGQVKYTKKSPHRQYKLHKANVLVHLPFKCCDLEVSLSSACAHHLDYTGNYFGLHGPVAVQQRSTSLKVTPKWLTFPLSKVHSLLGAYRSHNFSLSSCDCLLTWVWASSPYRVGG